jgi:hypothetical protein
MSSPDSRYELTPEISKRLISLLNLKAKRAPVFGNARRQKLFVNVVGMISREVERTGGVYVETNISDLRKVQAQAQRLQSIIGGLNGADNTGLWMMFWSLCERRRRAIPKKVQPRVPLIRFRAIGAQLVTRIASQEPSKEPTAARENSGTGNELSGWESLRPDEMLSVLIEAAEQLIAKQAHIPPNRRYPNQTPKSRMFIRHLVHAYNGAFGRRPTSAKDGYFGSIVNNLLREFGEEYEAGQDTLETIINDETKGFQRKRRSKPL